MHSARVGISWLDDTSTFKQFGLVRDEEVIKSVFSDKLVYYSTKTTLGLTIYNIHPPMNRSYSQFYIFTKNLFKVQSPLWNSPNAPFVRLVLFYFHSSCWLYLVITKILSCLVRSSVILINWPSFNLVKFRRNCDLT